jgi:hypothetical protein
MGKVRRASTAKSGEFTKLLFVNFAEFNVSWDSIRVYEENACAAAAAHNDCWAKMEAEQELEREATRRKQEEDRRKQAEQELGQEVYKRKQEEDRRKQVEQELEREATKRKVEEDKRKQAEGELEGEKERAARLETELQALKEMCRGQD